MGQSFLGSDKGKHFGVRVEGNAEAPLIPAGNGLSKRRQPVIGRIALISGYFRFLVKPFDNMRWSGLNRISNAQANHVYPLGFFFGYLLINLREKIGW